MLQPGPGADEFERDFFNFLKEFQKANLISELSGGPKNTLTIDQQVDVSFRFTRGTQDYFFVAECKNPEDPENFSLSQAVEQLRTRYDLVTDRADMICKGAFVKPVLAVNVPLDRFKTIPDSVLTLMNPQPTYFTSDHLSYYSELMSSYGPEYTLPLFLLEMFQIRVDYGGELMFPALKTNRFGKTLYTFQIKASDALRIGYVHRASASNIPAQAYQRMLDPNRLKEIAEKLKANSFEANFPNNIVAEIDPKDCAFDALEGADSGTLRIKNRYASLRVVDGQHRLYAFLHAPSLRDGFQLVTSAFLDLSQAEQSTVFASINFFAKKVTPDLIDYLFSLETSRTHVGKAAFICRQLSEKDHVFDKNELFLGYGTRSREHYLGLHSIVRILIDEKRYRLILPKGGKLQKDSDDEETPRYVLREYFKAIKHNFYGDWNKGKDGFVKTANGIGVFLGLLSRIVTHDDYLEELDEKRFDKYLRKLKRTRWSYLRERVSASESDRQKVILELSKRMKLI